MRHIKKESFKQEVLNHFLEGAICFWMEYGIGDDDEAIEMNGGKQYISSYDKELYDELKNSLEILEILKRNLYVEKGTGIFKGVEDIGCSLDNKHSRGDFKKIKEWLKNE